MIWIKQRIAEFRIFKDGFASLNLVEIFIQ